MISFGFSTLPVFAAGAVFVAAAAFDAGVSLQRHELRHIFAGNQPEVLIAVERRDVAELAARKEKMVIGLKTRCRCLVCGMSGRNARMQSACAHTARRAAPEAGDTKNPARYVTISAKMRNAMTPDS